MAKKTKSLTSSFSYVLEEPIEVNWQVVGRPDWIKEKIPRSVYDRVIRIQPGQEEAGLKPIKDSLRMFPIHGLDSETGGETEIDGLQPWSDTSQMLLFQYGTPHVVYIFEPGLVPYLRDLLEDESYLHLNQNIIFDFEWLKKKYGVHTVRMYCTMLSEQLLRAGLPGFKVSLLDLARNHPPCRLISKGVRIEFIQHRGVFTEEQLYYAARDVALLFDVFSSQNKMLKKFKMVQVAQDEFAIIPATAEMEIEGVHIDQDRLRLTLSYFEMRARELEQEIMQEYNRELVAKGKKQKGFWADMFGESEEVFDLQSAKSKLEALERIGIDLDNVQRSTLKKIGNTICKLLVEYSEVIKICSTYGERLLARVHPSDNRLHPVFKQLGSGDAESSGGREKAETIATGRYSSDFQILPRPKKRWAKIQDPAEEAMVRQMFADKIAALTGTQLAA